MTKPPPPSSEKLQKVLARAGLGSRRTLERWIEAGRVSVNGTRATLGARVYPRDLIRVDGHRIPRPPSDTGGAAATKIRVLRYHKPVGEICSRADPEGRRSVFDALPDLLLGRWIAVGRLDIRTSGLLLFTDAGELAHRLMHPASGMEREYAVRVLPWGTSEPGAPATAAPTPAVALARLREGIRLEDGMVRFDSIVDAGGQGRNHWYHVIVKEGKTHEVRRLWEAVGFRVSRLIRVRYGPVELARALRPGRWEALSNREVAQLARCVGLDSQPRPPASRAAPGKSTGPSRGGRPRSTNPRRKRD